MYPFDDLKQLLMQAQKTALKRINILGGNIFLYPQISELIAYLNDYLANIYYHINHLNLNSTSIRLINSIRRDKDICVFLINPPLNESTLNMLLNTHNLKSHFFTFLVSSEKEYNHVVEFIEKYSLKHIYIVPIYVSENKSFFEQNVYVTMESIVEDQNDILSILRRGYLNEAGFKKLFVEPDKKIFSNLNLPAIAELGRNTLLYAIKRELKEGTFWKLLRKDVTPCKDCPFQLLCPPVSNYDFALKKHNLCTILEKEK